MADRIYLDHAATTPVRPEVREAMLPYLGPDAFGNPSSLHAEGQRAKHALDAARDDVARALGAEFSEITFTSGGTESDNMALLGVLLARRAEQRDHLVISAIEHEAVLNCAAFARTLGFGVTVLPVDEYGLVSPADAAAAITEGTALVSVMHANNEVGTIQPVREIADAAHMRGALMHTDAVQSFVLLDFSVADLGADLLTISAHKIGGPKGVGALYARRGAAIEPWLHGGAQERERRAGTENVAGIVGFGVAARLLTADCGGASAHFRELRDGFIADLRAHIPGLALNGHPTLRLPNNVNVSIPGGDAEALLLALDRAGIAASSGSACTSGSIEPSHVLTAMGLPDGRARSALRFTLGRETTREELRQTVDALANIVIRQGIKGSL